MFTVYILGVEVDKPQDVHECDTYTLPTLNVGNYFTEPNGQGTMLNAGDVLTGTQTLYIYSENGNRFLCTDEHRFTVNIYSTPTLPMYSNLESCDTLTLPQLDLPGFEINYYKEPGGVGLISPSNYTISEKGTQTIYVRANAIGNTNCFDETSFQITVFPLQELLVQGGAICVDYLTGQTNKSFLLRSGLDANEFTVNWYLNNELVGTGPNYNATVAGTYSIETIKLTPDVGAYCNYAPTNVVVEESKPEFEIEFLTDAFSSLTAIHVNTVNPGLGTYQFSLNGGPFQTDKLFYNIPLGVHTITVRDDTAICNEINIEFTALQFPKFFTPNDDGLNDLWNIPDLRNYPEAIVRIYDRFGRLVSVIKPSGRGWDGTTNGGLRAPSSDYWFEVEFLFQGKPTKYRDHFSLLRK